MLEGTPIPHDARLREVSPHTLDRETSKVLRGMHAKARRILESVNGTVPFHQTVDSRELAGVGGTNAVKRVKGREGQVSIVFSGLPGFGETEVVIDRPDPKQIGRASCRERV